MSIASEQRFYDYIYLKYEDDDGQPLDQDLGEVLWDGGRGSAEEGDVTYIRIDRVAELVRELRQYVINHEIGIGECVAWQELKAMVKDAQGVLLLSTRPRAPGRSEVRGMPTEEQMKAMRESQAAIFQMVARGAHSQEEADEKLKKRCDIDLSNDKPFPVRGDNGTTSAIPRWLAEVAYERHSVFNPYPSIDVLEQKGGFYACLLVRSLGANYEEIASPDTRYADELETFARELVELPDFKLRALDNALNGLSHDLYRMAHYMGHRYARCMTPVLRAVSDYGNKITIEGYKRRKASENEQHGN